MFNFIRAMLKNNNEFAYVAPEFRDAMKNHHIRDITSHGKIQVSIPVCYDNKLGDRHDHYREGVAYMAAECTPVVCVRSLVCEHGALAKAYYRRIELAMTEILDNGGSLEEVVDYINLASACSKHLMSEFVERERRLDCLVIDEAEDQDYRFWVAAYVAEYVFCAIKDYCEVRDTEDGVVGVVLSDRYFEYIRRALVRFDTLMLHLVLTGKMTSKIADLQGKVMNYLNDKVLKHYGLSLND